MAKPPRSMALKPPRAPDSLPMGVRAPAMMTEPGMDVTSVGTVSTGRGRSVGGAPFYGGFGETAPGPGQSRPELGWKGPRRENHGQPDPGRSRHDIGACITFRCSLGTSPEPEVGCL